MARSSGSRSAARITDLRSPRERSIGAPAFSNPRRTSRSNEVRSIGAISGCERRSPTSQAASTEGAGWNDRAGIRRRTPKRHSVPQSTESTLPLAAARLRAVFELRDQVEALDLIEPSDPPEECGGDIEGDVPDDSERGPRHLRIEGVTLVHEDVGPRPRGAKQLRGQRGIDLDGEHEPGGPRQFTCQSTGPRSDLHDEVRGSDVERPDELSRGSRAEEVPTTRRDAVARTRRTCAHGPSPHNPSAATSCDRVYGPCPPVVVHGGSWTFGHRHYPRRDES